MPDPERLSDVSIRTHGFSQEDVINNRLAGKSMVHDLAMRGNRMALMCENLDLIALQFGVDSTYCEDMDDDIDF